MNRRTSDLSELTVVPLRHPLRWAAVTVVCVVLLLIASATLTNSDLDWPTVGRYLFNPLIIQGVGTTIGLTTWVMALATAVGTAIALMLLSPSALLSAPARGFVWFFRGVPALVQLIFWYNLSILFRTVSLTVPGAGTLFSVPTNEIMTPLVSATAALALHEAGYMAEIIRAGLQSINKGQFEAASALGMPHSLLLRRIILPQAMRLIIPPTGNQAISLLKTTSLVSVIAVPDLLYSVQKIYARTFETIPLLLVASIWYLFTVSLMSIGQSYLERHFAETDARARPESVIRKISRLIRGTPQGAMP